MPETQYPGLDLEPLGQGLDLQPYQGLDLEPLDPDQAQPGVTQPTGPEIWPDNRGWLQRKVDDVKQALEPIFGRSRERMDELKNAWGGNDQTDEDFLNEHPTLKNKLYGIFKGIEPIKRMTVEDLMGKAPKDVDFTASNKLAAQVGVGVNNFVAGVADVLTSPGGVIAAMTGGVGPAIQKAIGYGFAVDMARHAPELAVDTYKAYKEGDLARATENGLNGLLTVAAVAHPLLPEKTAPASPIEESAKRASENNAPATAAAIEEPPLTLKGGSDASYEQETATVHGDLRTQSIEGTQELPKSQGSGGIQPQTKGRIQSTPGSGTEGGEVVSPGVEALKEPQPLTPEEQAIEQARLDEALGQEAAPEITGTTRPEPPSPQALGIVPGQALGNLVLPSPAEMKTAAVGTLRSAAGESMPKTTMANRRAGEIGAQYASSVAAVPELAKYAVNRVLQGTNIDPVKLGAALTENQLRGMRELHRANGDTESAGKVPTLVGEDGVFKTEAELRAFANDPQVQAAVARFKDIYRQEIDPLAESLGLDPSAKPPVGDIFPDTFINLFVPPEGTNPKTVVRGYGTPNLTATVKKGSKFQKKRTGTGTSYGIDFRDMMENVYGGFLERAKKNEFDKALVDAGLAVISKDKPEGEWTMFPYERSRAMGIDASTGEVQWQKVKDDKIWVKSSLGPEYAQASNLYKNQFSRLASNILGGIINKYQMAGVMDASFHLMALSRRLIEAPTGLNPAVDSALSLVERSDVAVKALKFAGNVLESFADRTAHSKKLAELAKIGAMESSTPSWKAPVRTAVHYISNNIRATLSDIHDTLSDKGVMPKTETSKREFINAGLQYNKRLQGPVMRALRETGIGPFVTAGRAGLARGIKRYTLHEWGQAEGARNRAYMAMSILSKAAGTAVAVMTAQYLINGTFTGRQGTKLGNLDLGDDKDGNMVQLEMANLLGNEVKGARILGIRGYVEGKRNDLDHNQAAAESVKDMANALIHPGIGPVPQFIYSSIAGKPTGVGVPDFPKVPEGGIDQYKSNLKHAFEQLNPMIYRSVQKLAGVEPEHPVTEPLLSALGVRKGGPQEKVEGLSGSIHGAALNEFIDNLISRAHKLPKDQRWELIQKEIEDLEGKDKKRVITEVKRRGVLKRP